MVRRVEWRIEQASKLLAFFPRGQALVSKEFDAAGITCLKLAFYPAGHQNAKDGYCSFFLYASAGVTLQCRLQTGKESKEMNLSFEGEDLLGRTNFCPFDRCIDNTDDSVLLIFEIEHAHQNITATAMHSPSWVSSRGALGTSKILPIESIVKLQRVAGGAPCSVAGHQHARRHGKARWPSFPNETHSQPQYAC